MADVKRLVFSILTFLNDQRKTAGLDDEQVESLEGSKPFFFSSCNASDDGRSIL